MTGEGEHWDPNWLDSDNLVLPPKQPWDYKREMQVEDVNIWEQIMNPWALAVFAAWDPYAEFYLLRFDKNYNWEGWSEPGVPPMFNFETYYGPGAHDQVVKRIQELSKVYDAIKVPRMNNLWVEPEKMWLYQPQS
jgi:hypothetical protein